MKIFKTNKKVLSVKNNPEKFLNGITANDLSAPRNAFCDIHGKIVATFDQLKISDDEMWLVIEADFVAPTLQHIEKFAKLSGAVIEELRKNVYFDLDKELVEQRPEIVTVPQRAGQLAVTANAMDFNITEEEFTIFRLQNNMPLLGVDYKNDFLLNVGEEEFVSFTKGCFLGQEPISKVHNRSKPTWKLVAKYEDECNDEEEVKLTSKAVDPKSNRPLGFVFVRNE